MVLFAIDGVPLHAPDGYEEPPITEVGRTLRGKPVHQGYAEFILRWSIMNQAQFSALWAHYDPENPEKLVTYIDKATGLSRVMQAMMHEPIVGQRQIVYYADVACRFSSCVPQ